MMSRSVLRSRYDGFSLIELLVGLAIIGITMGVIFVQLSPDERALLREEADKLAVLLENAAMEARSRGSALAWSGDRSGYRFWRKNRYGEWAVIEDDALFRTRIFPEGIGISEVTVQEQNLKPGDFMVLDAASFTVPYRVRLSAAQASVSISGHSTGAVTVTLDPPATAQ